MSPPVPSDRYIGEIRSQPEAIRRAAEAVLDQRPAFERIAEAADGARPVLTGMGSSHDACYPAVEHLAGSGVLALHETAAELLHFRLALLGPRTVLVLVSQSGESAEVVTLAGRLRAVRERPLVVSVTNGQANPLAERSDVRLDIRTGWETGPSSMTFAATLVLVGTLAAILSGEDPSGASSRLADSALAAAGAVETVLEREELVAGAVSDVARGRRLIALAGRGRARSVAEMGALTLKECGIVAEGFDSAAFRHGPFELAGPDLGAIVVATEPRTRSLELGLASDLRAAGSPVAVLTDAAPADEDVAADARTISIPSVDPLLSPAVAMVPVQLAAHRLSVEAGREPGSYVRASKVTARE